MNCNCLRGEIYYINFGNNIGSEQNGARPALVIQNDLANKFSTTTIVAAISTKKSKREIPTHYRIKKECGIKKDSFVLLEQIKTIEKSRIEKYICKLNDKQMEEIDSLVRLSLGLNCNNKENKKSSVQS